MRDRIEGRGKGRGNGKGENPLGSGAWLALGGKAEEASMVHLVRVAIGVAIGAVVALGEVRVEAALVRPPPVAAAAVLAAAPGPLAPPALVSRVAALVPACASITPAPELPPVPVTVARRKAKPATRRPRITQGAQNSPAPQKPKSAMVNPLDAALAP
jgi:hypothetical protein